MSGSGAQQVTPSDPVPMKIFDASAALAVLFNEPGNQKASQLIEEGDAAISAVNAAEVVARLCERGLAPELADAALASLRIEVLPFSAAQALVSGHLRVTTRALGLSLGDRCCLALAAEAPGNTVVTADRPWKALKGYKFTFIR